MSLRVVAPVAALGRRSAADPLRRGFHDGVAGTWSCPRRTGRPDGRPRPSTWRPQVAKTVDASTLPATNSVDNLVVTAARPRDDLPARRGREAETRRSHQRVTAMVIGSDLGCSPSEVAPRLHQRAVLRRGSSGRFCALVRLLAEPAARRAGGACWPGWPPRRQVGGSRFSRSLSGSAAGVAHRK